MAEELRAAARGETLHVLAARHQLRELALLAGDGGYRPVVLKGGAVLDAASALDLQDLDVLLPPERGRAFADLLEREAGFTGGGDVAGPRHLDSQDRVGRVPVEVHFRLAAPGEEGLPPDAAEPAALPRRPPVEWRGMAPLRRLAPVDQALHVLRHTCLQHLDRRGRIRDLLLLGRALADCSEEERREVEGWVRAHPFRRALAGQMALAKTLAVEGQGERRGVVGPAERRGFTVEDAGCTDGRGPADPFAAEAAVRYLSVGWLAGRGRPLPFKVVLRDAALALLGGRSDRAMTWRRAVARRDRERGRRLSPRPWLRFLQERAPRLARLAVSLLRPARLAAAFLVAAPVALAARILARTRGGLVSRRGSRDGS